MISSVDISQYYVHYKTSLKYTMNGCYMVYHFQTRSVMSMIIKLQIMFSSFIISNIALLINLLICNVYWIWHKPRSVSQNSLLELTLQLLIMFCGYCNLQCFLVDLFYDGTCWYQKLIVTITPQFSTLCGESAVNLVWTVIRGLIITSELHGFS